LAANVSIQADIGKTGNDHAVQGNELAAVLNLESDSQPHPMELRTTGQKRVVTRLPNRRLLESIRDNSRNSRQSFLLSLSIHDGSFIGLANASHRHKMTNPGCDSRGQETKQCAFLN
jgi:hypothetical protein